MPASELVQSLSRGLTILDRLAEADGALTLQEVCDAVDLKPPTVHNLLRTLIAHGYVEKTPPPRRYRLGTAPAELCRQQHGRALVRRARQRLRTLSGAYPHAQFLLAEARGEDVYITLRVSAARPGVVEESDTRLAPYNSASSLLMLAHWPLEARQAFDERYPLAECAQPLWRDAHELERFLTQVRQLGYACPPSRSSQDLFRVAAPVFEQHGRIVAALGCSMRDTDTDADGPAVSALIQTAKQGAAELSESSPTTTPAARAEGVAT